MRGLPGRIIKLGLMGLAVLGTAGIAYGLAGFGANSAPPDVAPADVVALRFPTAEKEARAQPAPAWFAADEQQLALFSPHPTYPVTAASYAPEATARPMPEPPSIGTNGKPSPALVQRIANRKPIVFNDAQIASIKSRLNLTKDQEEYWPAVEAMLRRLAWKKTPEDPRGKAAPGADRRLLALDVNSIDMARLQSTTGPLIMSFNEDQKRELRMLAHLAGMQGVFSKF
jgi:hypothetical protein